jgi:hypothetical protein
VLQTGHPEYGLPFGQDRIVPIFLATLAVRPLRHRLPKWGDVWLLFVNWDNEEP